MICRRMGDFSATQVIHYVHRTMLITRLLDTFVLDMIPNPEYLALANSLAFSIAVSWIYVSRIRSDRLGGRTCSRPIHGQLLLRDIHPRRITLFNRTTYRLGIVHWHLYPQSGTRRQNRQTSTRKGGRRGRKTRTVDTSDIEARQCIIQTTIHSGIQYKLSTC